MSAGSAATPEHACRLGVLERSTSGVGILAVGPDQVRTPMPVGGGASRDTGVIPRARR
jgi:hypothetical protein